MQFEGQLDVGGDGAPRQEAGLLEAMPYSWSMRACRAVLPNTDTVPVVGASRSAMRRSKVDLPHPEGPISETNSPGATVRSIDSSAVTVAFFLPIAGGKKVPEREALDVAFKAIDQGAAGVDMGRNIFQSEHPLAMITAVRAVVHDGLGAEDAFELFRSLAADSQLAPAGV